MNGRNIIELEDKAALDGELDNLRSILSAVYAYPESVSLRQIDLFGRSYPLAGTLGGDHLIFVDFVRRYDLDRRIASAEAAGRHAVAERLEENRRRVGVLVADVSGHSMTDAVLAAMLHQAFLVGVLYELEHNGQVTAALFDVLNTRFYKSSSVTKFVTMIYGEITEEGRFRFISAGHPRPLVYSAEFRRFVEIDRSSLISVHPIGLFPTEGDIDRGVAERPPAESPRSQVNEVKLMAPGDVLLLSTDGAWDQADGELIARLEPVMRTVAHRPARDIVDALHRELVRHRPAEDDLTLVAIRRN
ncbi:MAG TPA: PP2C family protein-serine/threonine phosphatase [Candidatus Sulfomarinibacteraceae bacterium]|nr:PP2C family protein-serine/threonine phosphatase [Candidatus Sulfomarinibacteraceae bacterium]